MNDELYELKKSCDKERVKFFTSFVIMILICGIGVLKIWPVFDRIMIGNNIGDFLGATIKLGSLLLFEMIPGMIFIKSANKHEELLGEIIILEGKREQKEKIKKFSKRFQSLSKEKQEEFLKYIDGNLFYNEMFDEIDGLDYENMELLKKELNLLIDTDSVTKESITTDISRCSTVEYVIDEIDSWKNDDFMKVMGVVLEDIKRDKELLKYYLPEVDFDVVDIDLVYDKLFNNRDVNDIINDYIKTKKREL